MIELPFSDFGFLDFGVAQVQRAVECEPSYTYCLERGYFAGMEYMKRNLEKRFDPSLLVEGAQSVLCFLAPYGQSAGGVAGFACGKDYHRVVKDRLFKIISHLKSIRPDFEGRPFVDSAPVLERWWAACAGLGFIGRNRFLISPKYGLRTIIGVIICNIPPSEFPPHEPLAVTDCGDCGKCRAACPGGALDDPTGLDARRCISYHTVEAPDEEVCPVDCKGWSFGCEECLKACLWNRDIPSWPEFGTNRSLLETVDWTSLPDDEFLTFFSDSGLMRSRRLEYNLQLSNFA